MLPHHTPLPDSALEHFSRVIADSQSSFIMDAGDSSLLLRACQRIFAAIGVKADALDHRCNSIARIAKTVGCPYRQVKLSGKWWHKDNGVLLAFHRQTGRPCALLPKKYGGYQLFDPGDGSCIDVTAEIASVLNIHACLFYRVLRNQSIRLKDLLVFALSPHKKEIVRILFAQLMIGLFGLLIPIATGYLFESVVPNAAIDLLWQFVLGLMVATFSMTAFNIMQVLALMRLRFKVNWSVQAAVWNRLLSLPIEFFRRFSAGDLADRSGVIDAIQARLTGAMLKAILSGVFSILTLALMCYYSVVLTVIAFSLLLVTAAIIIVVNLIQLGYQRQHYAINGRLKGFMLQILTGISKLRIAHCEANAYEQWSVQFSKKMRVLYQSGRLRYYLDLFQVFFTITNLIMVFYVVVAVGKQLSFGQFIAFNAAYGQFLAAFFGLTAVVTELMGVVPLYERIKPILQATHEVSGDLDAVIDWNGNIEVSKLSFCYGREAESPLVLNRISLSVKTGQFVAIVGLSGSGKSTLLRLLMGFEKPLSGHIYYGNHDLSLLNPAVWRENLGVVLQNQLLMPGTILENISDTTELSEERAWELAKVVGIDEEIAAMPMKMQTHMLQSGRSLSVGQRQRIALARALAKHPKLLLLDEATSALDNATQKYIYHKLLNLSMTKIVVAHRLSTIVDADCIYVFDKGEIIQQGSYWELMQQPGLFADLAQRQLG